MTASLHHAHQLILRGDFGAADDALRAASRENPDPFEFASVRGALHMGKLEWDDALAQFQACLVWRPIDFGAHFNAGLAYFEKGDLPAAILAFRHALLINPSYAPAWQRIGAAHLMSRHYAEALACHERAHGLDPTSPDIMTSYATTLNVHGDDHKAEQLYRKAWKKSGHPVSEAALGFVLLRQGKWGEGWRRFQARWKLRNFGMPFDYRNVELWSGKKEDLAGKRVLLRSEQGYGDTIQFSRYISWVRDWTDHVWLETEPSLATLMRGLGAEVLIRGQNQAPEFDIQTSLMTLPLVFGTLPDRDMPAPAKLNITPRDPGAEIGVCWHGGARPWDPAAHADDQRRSIAPEVFAPIFGVAPCVSLQEDDLRAAGVTDWLGTAERIAGLKLVITVDTAIAHLAATLGIETWLLLRAAGCWRWMNTGDRTTWYPSARLYRQPALDAWEPVVQDVVRDLRKWRDAHG